MCMAKVAIILIFQKINYSIKKINMQKYNISNVHETFTYLYKRCKVVLGKNGKNMEQRNKVKQRETNKTMKSKIETKKN